MESLSLRVKRLGALGAKFLVVGGISTVIEIAVFNLCLLVLHLDVVPAKIIASLVALVNAYLGNRQWVFRKQAGRGRTSELVHFVIVNAVCTGLGALLVWAGVQSYPHLFGSEPGTFAINVINLLSIAVVVVVRFTLYHKLVFRPDPRTPLQ